jgi:nicotinamidase-related amidase
MHSYIGLQLPTPSCLLVVDPQVQFRNDHTRHIFHGIEEIIPRYDFVIYSRLVPDENGVIERFKRWRPSEVGTPGYAWCIRTDLLPSDRTLIVDKTCFSAITPGCLEWIRSKRIEEIHLVGGDTDLCLMLTAADALRSGLRPVVLAGLCASFAGEPLHTHALIQLKRMLGKAQVIFPSKEGSPATRPIPKGVLTGA